MKESNLQEIVFQYKQAKLNKLKWERVMGLLLQLFKVRKQMELLASKYDHLIKLECDEKFKGGEVSITFCVAKCTYKCKSFLYIQKKYPKLVQYVRGLNEKYFEINDKIMELTKGL